MEAGGKPEGTISANMAGFVAIPATSEIISPLAVFELMAVGLALVAHVPENPDGRIHMAPTRIARKPVCVSYPRHHTIATPMGWRWVSLIF